MNKNSAIAFLFLLTGCLGRNDSKNNEIEVELSVEIDNIETRDLNLSEIASDFTMVFLETNETALINRPREFALNDDYIIIVDIEQKPSKLFTAEGKYVRDIGSIGVGPDEYLTVVSPHIDKTDNSVWLLLGGNYSHPKEGWIYTYNNSGELINRINTFDRSEDESANGVLIHSNKVIKPGNVGSKNMIVIKSIDNENIIKITNRIPSDYFTYTTNTSIVYPYGENLHFKIGESDTIYSLSPEGMVTPIATVFTNRYKFDEEKVKLARSSRGPGRFENILAAVEGCYSIELLGETAKYYLLSVAVNGAEGSTKLLAVDKGSGESFFFEIINDFLFNISEERQPYIYNNEYIIFHYPAIAFIDALRKKIEETKDTGTITSLETLAASVNADDNDILLICKMKL